MSDDYGPWSPLGIPQLSELFAGAPFPWWVTGGVALELYTGRSWRDHDDIDVGIRRIDAGAVHRHLRRFHLCVAASGRLRPWDGRPLDPAAQENNVWMADGPGGPWLLDMAVGEGDDTRWVYRRAPTVTLPWAEAVLMTPEGVPYLAPQVQLLFKAKGLRPKDDVDARVVIPLLGEDRRRWLVRHLPAGHPWLGLGGPASG
ncbi:MAG TPA: hypothetical protein VFP54_11840 [Acidimicrobiales bacterium]|nr:hypothetical protein [Acidimicrobiales bacterium]